MSDILSVVSVDVLALHYTPSSQTVRLGLDRRAREPFRGRLALPGVVVHSGERLNDAATRACGKLADSAPRALGQLHTFDEPSRDPRGPSLSLAMWAVLADLGDHSIELGTGAVPDLAFDHNAIVAHCLPLIGRMLWTDLSFTRALLPAEFSTRDALAVTRALTGTEPHRSNLNRTLDGIDGLVVTGTAHGGAGRPAALRRFVDTPPR